jgi:hypothetical protein
VRVQLLRRNIFVSSKGYLGLGPKRLEVEDVVTILDGVSIPMILRPKGSGRFQLVGESYVPGIMDGEPVGKSNPVVIELD